MVADVVHPFNGPNAQHDICITNKPLRVGLAERWGCGELYLRLVIWSTVNGMGQRSQSCIDYCSSWLMLRGSQGLQVN